MIGEKPHIAHQTAFLSLGNSLILVVLFAYMNITVYCKSLEIILVKNSLDDNYMNGNARKKSVFFHRNYNPFESSYPKARRI